MYSYTLSLTSAVDGVGGQRHTPAALPPGKRPGTIWIGERVGSGPDGCAIFHPHRDSIPGLPALIESPYRLLHSGSSSNFVL